MTKIEGRLAALRLGRKTGAKAQEKLAATAKPMSEAMRRKLGGVGKSAQQSN